MKNKITRDNQVETNKTTAFWLYEFAHDLDKKAQNVDYLKDYINKNYNKKKFNSIEEKLADIKKRVGFDLAKKIVDQIEKTSSDSNEQGAGCGCPSTCKKCKGDCKCEKPCSCSVKTASKKDSSKKTKKPKKKEHVDIMKTILKYIKDMVIDQPYLDPTTVMSRCKETEGLKYNHISHIINHDRLMSYIEKVLSQHGHAGHNHQVYYIPLDPSSLVDSKIDIADYYSHAEPHRS